ncbi:MAG: hypothetical protein ABI537_17605, partial [Casimicrobiaceae bacterium]
MRAAPLFEPSKDEAACRLAARAYPRHRSGLSQVALLQATRPVAASKKDSIARFQYLVVRGQQTRFPVAFEHQCGGTHVRARIGRIGKEVPDPERRARALKERVEHAWGKDIAVECPGMRRPFANLPPDVREH